MNRNCRCMHSRSIPTATQPVLLPVAEAYRADLALRQGRLAEAARWAHHFDPEPLTAMYLAYSPVFTLAKVLLAENTDESHSPLGRLLDRLEGEDR